MAMLPMHCCARPLSAQALLGDLSSHQMPCSLPVQDPPRRVRHAKDISNFAPRTWYQIRTDLEALLQLGASSRSMGVCRASSGPQQHGWLPPSSHILHGTGSNCRPADAGGLSDHGFFSGNLSAPKSPDKPDKSRQCSPGTLTLKMQEQASEQEL